MKEKKINKRIDFILKHFSDLNIKFSHAILEREGKPSISDYLDDDGDWNGKYHDSYEYFFWNFCALCDDNLDTYENKAIHIKMEYDIDKTDKNIGEYKIDLIVYFRNDKAVDIVGMDYHQGVDFHYVIEKDEKFKKTFKMVLSDFISESNRDSKYKIKTQS